jgi:hypothetical protein
MIMISFCEFCYLFYNFILFSKAATQLQTTLTVNPGDETKAVSFIIISVLPEYSYILYYEFLCISSAKI